MIVGILKEIKSNEHRVCMTPGGVHSFIQAGHKVVVEKSAGVGSGFSDAEYEAQGAIILSTAKEIFDAADMVMHVKEPQPQEYTMLRENQILFTYLHLAADKPQVDGLIKAKSVNIAYETVRLADGSFPLLAPMSEVAGRMAIQEGAKYLEKHYGGFGVLLGGVPGVEPSKVVVIGAGVVGVNAARMAAGLGADVYLLAPNPAKLRDLELVLPKNIRTIVANPFAVKELLKVADVVVGAVYVPGSKTPKLVTRADLKTMKPGAVLVDVAIDQGGCFETSKATTHQDPIYEVDGIIHYCVANMPGAVARTSTQALVNATLPYALSIANKGWKQAAKENKALAQGINIVDGKIYYPGVAEAFGMELHSVDELLGN